MLRASEICCRAAELVSGDRNRTHGDKRANHAKIAGLWNAYLKIRRLPDTPLGAGDVATMMALLKIARMELGDFNPDDAVDGAGYIAIRGELDAAP